MVSQLLKVHCGVLHWSTVEQVYQYTLDYYNNTSYYMYIVYNVLTIHCIEIELYSCKCV